MTGAEKPDRRLAYFSAQAVVEGQDTWAAVFEIVRPIERLGWHVDVYRPEYAETDAPGLWRRLARILAVQRGLARSLRSYDALYVRVHPLAWPIAMRAHRLGVPVVQESNGSWDDAFMAWPAMRRLRKLVIALQRAQYRRADAVIAVSEGLARWIERETGRSDVVVSPNGANNELFRPDAARLPGMPDRYVAFFGQFAPWQGIPTLLEAVRRPEWPAGVSLVLAGDGALKPDVERAAALDGRVRYLGLLPYASVPGLVANALASFVLTYAPERAGYSPLKLYESMACGVPVVCTDTPGQAEYVRAEKAGVIVPPGDPAAVARAVTMIVADPAAAREMGARGRAAVEARYSWSVRARERLSVIESVLKTDGT